MDQDCTVGYSKFFAAFVGKQSPLIMLRYISPSRRKTSTSSTKHSWLQKLEPLHLATETALPWQSISYNILTSTKVRKQPGRVVWVVTTILSTMPAAEVISSRGSGKTRGHWHCGWQNPKESPTGSQWTWFHPQSCDLVLLSVCVTCWPHRDRQLWCQILHRIGCLNVSQCDLGNNGSVWMMRLTINSTMTKQFRHLWHHFGGNKFWLLEFPLVEHELNSLSVRHMGWIQNRHSICDFFWHTTQAWHKGMCIPCWLLLLWAVWHWQRC